MFQPGANLIVRLDFPPLHSRYTGVHFVVQPLIPRNQVIYGLFQQFIGAAMGLESQLIEFRLGFRCQVELHSCDCSEARDRTLTWVAGIGIAGVDQL